MGLTIFLTIMSGVVTYVFGQLVVKLLVEPVQDLRRTIGLISHATIEHAGVFGNPGVSKVEVAQAASTELRRLSSQLQSHLYLVPAYDITARVFRLPPRENLLEASKALIGLSNNLFHAGERSIEWNMKWLAKVCDALGIYLEEGRRWPKELT